MLAEPRSAVPRGAEWLYEIKLDGYRAEAATAGSAVRLYSRRANDLTADYPSVVRALSKLQAQSLLMDGEIVALDGDGRPSFQALQHRAGRGFHVMYFAFDLLSRNGRDLRRLPLEKRKAQLAAVLMGSDVRVSESLEGDPDAIVEAIRAMKLEGVIAKRRGSHYRSGRTGDWIKVKLLHQQEFVVAGYKPGSSDFESLIVGYHENVVFRFAAKVRNGFHPRARSDLWKLLVAPNGPLSVCRDPDPRAFALGRGADSRRHGQAPLAETEGRRAGRIRRVDDARTPPSSDVHRRSHRQETERSEARSATGGVPERDIDSGVDFVGGTSAQRWRSVAPAPRPLYALAVREAALPSAKSVLCRQRSRHRCLV
jgi:DNA ligase D-like protein (predicted ligase)